MRINSLVVRNFRAISQLELTDLRDAVVIAGPNGCGKSCVFDAIRLLKSAYGGYQPNEWQSWFGEFQINFNQRPGAMLALFQDQSKPLETIADITLSSDERAFIKRNAAVLVEEQIWREMFPEVASWRYFSGMPFAAQMRVHQPEVTKRSQDALPELIAELERDHYQGRLVIAPDAKPETSPSRLLELIFSVYDPQNIGIVDYHGATRNYTREQIGGINLNLDSDQRLRQHALYNWTNKYNNLKTEMASVFIRQLLAKEAGGRGPADEGLTETLQELFSTFFPGKEFLGPTATTDGTLLFPVRTPSGFEHDIDELSSGEKEVLYGYLRLRNSAPRASVILIDEPELHLNPRLVSGLASFYYKHLSRALGNQLWLVTHSDTLIREAVSQPGYSVYHMQSPGKQVSDNQASAVRVVDDVERVVIDLVGDLAAYRPGAKIVLFEGGGNSEFDVRMTLTLFPEFAAAVNAISGGDRARVSDLYEVLDQASGAGHLPAQFYAITDGDGIVDKASRVPQRLRWDVYHIENYLLDPVFIRKVLVDVNASSGLGTTDAVFDSLRQCAELTVPAMIAHRLRVSANKALVSCIDLGFRPEVLDPAAVVAEAAQRSVERIGRAALSEVSVTHLRSLAEEAEATARDQLQSGEWLKTFRGRDILRRFAGTHTPGIRYESVRDLIVARMRDADHRPEGMRVILDGIMAAPWRRGLSK